MVHEGSFGLSGALRRETLHSGCDPAGAGVIGTAVRAPEAQ